LDQDTTLPWDFLERMVALARRWQDIPSIGAIVPQLVDGIHILSPNYVRLLRHKVVPRGFTGISWKELYALNSGTLLRVATIRELGGFCEDFWLDQLDLWLHHRLHRAGKQVFVAGNIQVEHQLSLMDYASLAPTRYRNFLEAESAFFDLYRKPIDRLILTTTLLFRYYKRRGSKNDPAIAKEIGEQLKRRIRLSRIARVTEWKASVARRTVVPLEKANCRIQPPDRPRVSVCMATFQGELYLEEQLRSILSQLGANDEINIVDDGSLDRTCEIIRSFNDRRIRLVESPVNRGVLLAFEASIRMASGEVIFLSDQDDLWIPTKVSKVLHAFASQASANVVVSDATIIDEEGTLLEDSYYRVRGAFTSCVLLNFVRCRFLGCTMAFRGSLLEEILPFPARYDVLHDVWIGMRNTLSGGETIYLDEALVRYRRHSQNVTRTRTIWRQIGSRLSLFVALTTFMIRRRFGRRNLSFLNPPVEK